MAEEFFLPSAIVVGEYAVARGTEAVKLSVKLLSGLTLIALVAVAIVGLSHSANAADTDGVVYVTNKASGLTTEPSTAVSGRKSATTVYGTYASIATTGVSARDIVANSDKLIVTVVDGDVNATTTVTSDQAGSGFDIGTNGDNTIGTGVTDFGGGASKGLDSLGDIITVVLTDQAANPIVGAIGDIKIVQAGTATVVTGLSVFAIVGAGDGVSAPVIQISRSGTPTYTALIDVRYPSSSVDTLTVGIKSVVATEVSLLLTETGRNTGRFEGTIQVLEFKTASVTAGVANTSIPASGGPITVTYTDVAVVGTGANVKRTGTYNIDTTTPSVVIGAPADANESQNRLPVFSGTAADAQSGLDVSTFELIVDDLNDSGTNATYVIVPSTGAFVAGDVAAVDTAALGSDGATTVSWSWSQPVQLPTDIGSAVPNTLVDFQARIADLAGNRGFSDADTADDIHTTGRHGNQPHVIKIDQKIPSITDAESGIGLNTAVTPSIDKDNVRDTIKVTFDGKVKEASVSASDFKVTLDSGVEFVPASVVVKNAAVYLDIDSTIPSDDTPKVTIQGTIQDLAGNSTDAGSANASDELDPVLTVTRSAGSGTGTSGEAADSLTKKNMTFTITSDETLQGPPTLTLTNVGGSLGTLFTGLPTSLGGNSWVYIYDGSAKEAGSVAVRVVGTDVVTNVATIGDTTTKAFTVDLSLVAPLSSPVTTTTQSNPFLITDYTRFGGGGGETASVTITTATLDGVDVASEIVASADSKTFFYQPTTALTNASHKYIVKGTDAAGNTLTITNTFTKSDRTDFAIELFAGWNSLSVPSNPLETGVDAVLSNSGITQVVAYDATTPSQPWRIASKVGTGVYTSQTTPGLTNVTSGSGYWVETSDFEDQKIALEGPTGPGDARPGLTTIPTGNGWNLVGVVDQSRAQTQSGHKGATLQRPDANGTPVNVTVGTYFNTVNSGRAYVFQTVTSQFNELVSGDLVKIGTGIWVFISPQSNGQLPHIVP